MGKFIKNLCFKSTPEQLGTNERIAKKRIQHLWKIKLGWDEDIPLELAVVWTRLLTELNLLNNFRIPRVVIDEFPHKSLEIHGFCDASQEAFGACLYVRTTGACGTISTHLLCAKSRVAPLKTVTIPRLELSAAVLLSKLVDSVKGNLRIPIDNIFYWSDSTIVLAWLSHSPSNLNTFVANRVGEIQRLTNISNWRHVSSEDNPADVISRGSFPSELINRTLWFKGPEWLSKGEKYWPTYNLNVVELPELRKLSFVSTIKEDELLAKFSSFLKLQRVVATCFRFAYNCTHPRDKITKTLTATELTKATLAIVKRLQNLCFTSEISDLKNTGFVC